MLYTGSCFQNQKKLNNKVKFLTGGLYTWLYYKSGRNIAVPVIYHTIHGISGIYAGYAVMDIKSNIAMAVVYAIPALILVLTSSVYKGKKKND